MIDKKMENAINKQINAELYSEYMYLSMSAFFESINLKGFSHWMQMQASEERIHAMKFYKYLFDRGGKVILTQIDSPKTKWTSPLEVFKDVYKHETKVTDMINNLVRLSDSLKDYATRSFLQWYVDEQVEEEASADEVVQKLQMIKTAPGGLYMFDKELGQRQPPAAPKEDQVM